MSRLVLTPGDPAGVGPEVTARALVQRPGLDAVIIGDGPAFQKAAHAAGLTVRQTASWPDSPGVWLVDPADSAEPVEVAAIRAGTRACLDGRAAALVTGPIHKAKLAARGFAHPGHTDFLGELCGVSDPVMAFVGGSVRVVLVTVHLPLSAVPVAITAERVLHTVRIANAALRDQLGIPTPRLTVCGLNPHAGDDGLLGREEIEVIGPAAAQARSEGIQAQGPVSAETAFRLAVSGDTDMVVAMYHDQGLAPLKALDFGRSVNWTLGLPIVRTSVDHGTAYDIAWTGRADATSMGGAMDLALQLTG
ncbi:MAG: 4-hydroxythreonine-4-phosphate dehydrogenase [Myxococcota bacterium]